MDFGDCLLTQQYKKFYWQPTNHKFFYSTNLKPHIPPQCEFKDYKYIVGPDSVNEYPYQSR